MRVRRARFGIPEGVRPPGNPDPGSRKGCRVGLCQISLCMKTIKMPVYPVLLKPLFFLLILFPVTTHAQYHGEQVATREGDTYVIVAAASLMVQPFKAGVPGAAPVDFRIEVIEGRYFLMCGDREVPRVMKIELELRDSDLIFPMRIVGESCTGAPCSSCKFKPPIGGGCDCVGSGSCNHAIWKLNATDQYHRPMKTKQQGGANHRVCTARSDTQPQIPWRRRFRAEPA